MPGLSKMLSLATVSVAAAAPTPPKAANMNGGSKKLAYPPAL